MTEIPDYKVEAALRHFYASDIPPRDSDSWKTLMDASRRALEAAAAAQEPPRIEVTVDMNWAGARAHREAQKCDPDMVDFATIYRAMRALEPKAEADPWVVQMKYHLRPRWIRKSHGGTPITVYHDQDERSGKDRRVDVVHTGYMEQCLSCCRNRRTSQRRQTQGDER